MISLQVSDNNEYCNYLTCSVCLVEDVFALPSLNCTDSRNASNCSVFPIKSDYPNISSTLSQNREYHQKANSMSVPLKFVITDI